MHDELRERGVEFPAFERQRLSRRTLRAHPGMARVNGRDERLGGIDGRHAFGAEPIDEHSCQRPWTASDIENPLTRSDAREVGEHRRERDREAPHEAVIGLGCDDETH